MIIHILDNAVPDEWLGQWASLNEHFVINFSLLDIHVSNGIIIIAIYMPKKTKDEKKNWTKENYFFNIYPMYWT